MLYGLTLPPYSEVKHLEGTGNFAVKKYYRFPYKLFYLKKLEMISDILYGFKTKRNILDFGCGEAQIFRPELKKHTLSVTSIDKLQEINPSWKFDVIVCASVVEFLPLTTTAKLLKRVLAPGGKIIISSPMQTKLSRFYFWLIQDANQRHTHDEIIDEFLKEFDLLKYKTWAGLYFTAVFE